MVQAGSGGDPGISSSQYIDGNLVRSGRCAKCLKLGECGPTVGRHVESGTVRAIEDSVVQLV